MALNRETVTIHKGAAHLTRGNKYMNKETRESFKALPLGVRQEIAEALTTAACGHPPDPLSGAAQAWWSEWVVRGEEKEEALAKDESK